MKKVLDSRFYRLWKVWYVFGGVGGGSGIFIIDNCLVFVEVVDDVVSFRYLICIS